MTTVIDCSVTDLTRALDKIKSTFNTVDNVCDASIVFINEKCVHRTSCDRLSLPFNPTQTRQALGNHGPCIYYRQATFLFNGWFITSNHRKTQAMRVLAEKAREEFS